jgi:hypothetical protein
MGVINIIFVLLCASIREISRPNLERLPGILDNPKY